MNTAADTTVSYVVTVYNFKAPFLSGVLAALRAECDATDGEIVLIDDGSTDGSASMLAAFADDYPRARVLAQPNRGVAAATNRGIAAAARAYIRLVDADDVIVAGSTALLRGLLVSTGCDFSYGRMAHAPQAVPAGAPKYRILRDPLSGHAEEPAVHPVDEPWNHGRDEGHPAAARRLLARRRISRSASSLRR